MPKRQKGVSAKRLEAEMHEMLCHVLIERRNLPPFKNIKPLPGDTAYLKAIAGASAIFFTHGRQYEGQWWKDKDRAFAAAFELKRKGVRMYNWAKHAAVYGEPFEYDKPRSSALDALNGAAFLAASIGAAIEAREKANANRDH